MMGSGELIVMLLTCRCKALDESCGKYTPLLCRLYYTQTREKRNNQKVRAGYMTDHITGSEWFGIIVESQRFSFGVAKLCNKLLIKF